MLLDNRPKLSVGLLDRYYRSGARFADGFDSTVRIWDAVTGELAGNPLQAHTEQVNAIAFSPCGTQIASGSYDRTIILWDVETGSQIGKPLKGHTDGVYAVAFSPKGAIIASGGADKTIRLWDAKKRARVGSPLKGHTGDIASLAFSPDGARLESGAWDFTIRVWDAKTGASVGGPLRGSLDGVRSVSFSLDGTRIASGAEKTISVWEVTTRKAREKSSTTAFVLRARQDMVFNSWCADVTNTSMSQVNSLLFKERSAVGKPRSL